MIRLQTKLGILSLALSLTMLVLLLGCQSKDKAKPQPKKVPFTDLPSFDTVKQQQVNSDIISSYFFLALAGISDNIYQNLGKRILPVEGQKKYILFRAGERVISVFVLDQFNSKGLSIQAYGSFSTPFNKSIYLSFATGMKGDIIYQDPAKKSPPIEANFELNSSPAGFTGYFQLKFEPQQTNLKDLPVISDRYLYNTVVRNKLSPELQAYVNAAQRESLLGL